MRAVSWLWTMAALVAAGGCVAIADVDDIDFGPSTGAQTGTTTGTAAGGGGSSATCDDGVQNGQETGQDCGGPDCEPCEEDCQNGVDDNGDDLVDCADPICSGYHCVPDVPAGWSGPHAFFSGESAAGVSCDPAWALTDTAFGGTLNAPPAQCDDCGCSAPSGGHCVAPVADFYVGDGCSGVQDHREYFEQGSDLCYELGTGTYNSVSASPIMTYGGSCTVDGGAAAVPVATFSQQAVICGQPTVGGGCAADTPLCVRRPPPPFGATVCISQRGDPIDCPNGTYPDKYLLYRNYEDTRDCTGCSCGMPWGQTCAGFLTVFTNDLCDASGAVEVAAGTTCQDQANIGSASYTITNNTPSGGSCPAHGGEPIGTATPTDPLTLCCRTP